MEPLDEFDRNGRSKFSWADRDTLVLYLPDRLKLNNYPYRDIFEGWTCWPITFARLLRDMFRQIATGRFSQWAAAIN